MVSNNLKEGHYFRIGLTSVSLILLILSTTVLPAGAVINATSAEIRGQVWNESAPVIFWNPLNFAGFFYDIKDNLGTENLTILTDPAFLPMNRTIPKGQLYYVTTAQTKALQVASALSLAGDNAGLTDKGLEQAAPGKAFDGGKYWILGWQGEKYVAINGKVNKLSKLILEQDADDTKNLAVGETWNVGDGWALTLNSVTPEVWITLRKNGVKKDDKVVTFKPIFSYVEKWLGGETDVPVFVTYASNISDNMVQLRYTWLISESVTEVSSNDTYGVFKNANINNKNLTLSNDDTSITLTRDSTVNLMGDLNFKVADSDALRFYPMVMRDQPGTYEVRGSIWNDTFANNADYWTPQTFAGFYYDIEDNLGTENLSIVNQPNLQGEVNSVGGPSYRTIDKSNLIYSTTAQSKALQVAEALGLEGNNSGLTARGLGQAAPGKALDGGLYNIAGWQGEKYVAVNGKIDKLSKLVIEQGHAASDKKTLLIGETWNIGDGWALKVNSTNITATPKKGQFILSKDGIKKNETVINEGWIYTYVENNLSNETDVPVFVTFVDYISDSMVQLRYTWAISESVTQISSAATYGVFKDANVNGITLTLTLHNGDAAVSLTRDSIIPLMDNVKFKVADSDTLRFYPFVTYEVSEPAETRGDLNRNGRRDTGDATLMLRNIVHLPIPSQYMPVIPIGDMNCNNMVDTGDATLLLRDIVKLPILRCWE